MYYHNREDFSMLLQNKSDFCDSDSNQFPIVMKTDSM